MCPLKPLNRSRRKIFVVAASLAMSISFTLGSMTDAEAKITAFFSAGTSCDGSPSASFAAGGSVVKVSLCVTTTTEALCGHTIKLQAADASDSGRFHVTAVSLGANYSDPNSELKFPIAIVIPPAAIDFGATVSRAAVAPAAKQLLVTFDISPQSSATKELYAIVLAPNSTVGVRTDSACALPTDSPIAANFKLIHRRGTEPRK